MYEFRWNQWNVDHIDGHGIGPEEAEYVVNHAARPYPQFRGDQKWLVIGPTAGGEYVQVIFIFSPADVAYVIHAGPLTPAEKTRYRKRRN